MPKHRISYAQKQLPFSGAARPLIEPLRRERMIVLLSLGALFVTALVYGYCVVGSIAQVSLRESARTELKALTAERAELEGTFLEKTRGITLEYARTLGYQEAKEKVFVTRPSVLSYARDAR